MKSLSELTRNKFPISVILKLSSSENQKNHTRKELSHIRKELLSNLTQRIFSWMDWKQENLKEAITKHIALETISLFLLCIRKIKYWRRWRGHNQPQYQRKYEKELNF